MVVDVDIDPNDDDDDYIYQVTDDRFFLVFRVNKGELAETRKAIIGLRVGEEAVFGTTGSGDRVWICRDKGAYCIAIGDTDSKDVSYKITKAEFNELIRSEPTE
jgi:hypothetical protein